MGVKGKNATAGELATNPEMSTFPAATVKLSRIGVVKNVGRV